jgi:hypothetical protein
MGCVVILQGLIQQHVPNQHPLLCLMHEHRLPTNIKENNDAQILCSDSFTGLLLLYPGCNRG